MLFRSLQKSAAKSEKALTLAELLVVMAMITILTVVGLPSLRSMLRTGGITAAQRQFLDDISRAQYLAKVHRTTVMVVFVPPDLNDYLAANSASLTAEERRAVQNLLVGQYTAYNFVSLRSVGDQPGKSYPKYL